MDARRRHLMRVRAASQRAAACDLLGVLDDAVLDHLSRVRRLARAAGVDRDTIDDVAMGGILQARNESP